MVWYLIIPALFYFLFIRHIYNHLRSVKQVDTKSFTGIKVSVIIPCNNEENNLPFLLKDLQLQNYDPDLFEVLVIDDNSTDSTFQFASSYKGIRNYSCLRNLYKGKKGAIIQAVDIASGELIITTDADCRFGPGWISAHVSLYNGLYPDLIIGPIKLEKGSGFFGRFQELEFLSLQGITAGTAQNDSPVMCNGANLSFKKSSYIRHSKNLWNDIPSGDDVFLLHSLKRDPSARILWLNNPEGIVTTKQCNTLFSYIRQRARWISKAGKYRDIYTINLAIVTFAAIISLVFLLIEGLWMPQFLYIFLIVLTIKSIPDFLLLKEVTRQYNEEHLLKWFIPSQVVYPFYVLTVAIASIFIGKKWK